MRIKREMEQDSLWQQKKWSMNLYTEQVALGKALLNKQKPQWRKKVDFNKLSMNSFSEDILGQIFGDFYVGIRMLGLDHNQELWAAAVRHGFASGVTGDDEALRVEWIAQMLEEK